MSRAASGPSAHNRKEGRRAKDRAGPEAWVQLQVLAVVDRREASASRVLQNVSPDALSASPTTTASATFGPLPVICSRERLPRPHGDSPTIKLRPLGCTPAKPGN